MQHEKDYTRQERREEKLRRRKARIKKHGKSLGRVYTDAVKKRLGKGRR